MKTQMKRYGTTELTGRFLSCLCLVLFIAVFAYADLSQAIPIYRVTNLGTLGNNTTLAYDLNDNGQVVGISVASSGSFRAFLWENGVMQDLNLGDNSEAFAINNQGHITGNYQTALFPFGEAYLYKNGTVQDLGTFSGNVTASSSGFDLSDSDQVVGFAETDFPTDRAFLSNNGGPLQDLGSLAQVEPLGGANAAAFAVNNNGQIVGFGEDFNLEKAFLWENGIMTNLETLGGSLGGDESRALGINDRGQIVGWAEDTNGNQRAFLFDNGVMTDLGALEGATESLAWDINEMTQIVGFYEFGVGRAFLIEEDIMYNLNDLVDPNDPLFNVNLADARAINEQGWIIANGIGDGGIRAFLLRPVAVPEPATIIMLGSGLSGLVAFRKKFMK